MICGIGIDSVDIQRFAHWKDYTHVQLKRIFTDEEIEYCTRNKTLMLERLAVRFAAKEAFYKAWCSFMPDFSLPLMSICTAVGVQHTDNGAPRLDIDWNFLYKHASYQSNIVSHLALTHTDTTATACVILERQENTNYNPLNQSSSSVLDEIELYLDSHEDEDEDEEDNDEQGDIEIEKQPHVYNEIYFSSVDSGCKSLNQRPKA